jgi:hypothetical protein
MNSYIYTKIDTYRATRLIINMINKNENTIDMNAVEKPYRNGGLYDPNIRGPVSTK